MKSHRVELIEIIEQLGSWEILPLLFQARRLYEGQKNYGKGRKYRQWRIEKAEEVSDLMNYFIWELVDNGEFPSPE